MMRRIVSLVALLVLSAAEGNAQAAGDPKDGLKLAQQVCAECHATVPQQDRSPNPRAPKFVDIANTAGMTRTALVVALTTPHAGMPMFTLTSKEKDDIITYVLSLH